jgi:taurine transport system permease protein
MSAELSLARPAARPRLGLGPAARDLVLQSLAVGVLLVLWEATARAGLITPFLLPAFSDVVLRVAGDVASGQFPLDAGLTLYRALVGFACAALVGVPIGMAIARGRVARWFCEPLVSIGFPMPKIAFLPIFMLWFGLFDLSKIVMTAFAAVFTVIAATDAGTRGVDKYLVWSARSLGARRLELFWEVILPAALPQILTGLQVALPVALITAVVTEMQMGGFGLGGTMMSAGRFADSVGVYAGIFETAAVGIVAIAGMARLRRRLLRWHAETSAPG